MEARDPGGAEKKAARGGLFRGDGGLLLAED
jgi:hypothetical protein